MADDVNLLLLALPLVLIQLGLVVLALLDLRKQEKVRYVSKTVWAIIIIIGEIFGPLVYFLFGRGE